MTDTAAPTIKIDIEKLTIRSQVELEEARGAKDILAWLDRYAEYDREAVLALPLTEIRSLGDTINKQMTAALEPGN